MTPKLNHIFLSPAPKNPPPFFIPPKYQYRAVNFLNGRVEAVGPDVTDISVGDTVAFDKDSGIEVEIGEQKFTVVKPAHIIAVV